MPQTTTQPAPTTTPKAPPGCPNGGSPSRVGSPHTGTNFAIGAVTGAAVTGGVALLILNVVGFPEMEAGEGVILLAAGSDAVATQNLLMALAGEPLMTNFIVGTTGAAYGSAVGGGVGIAATQPTCSNAGQGAQQPSPSGPRP